MFLDDNILYETLDGQDMHGEICALPGQLESAWASGLENKLPAMDGIERVLVAGMGGSAIGADLAAGWAAPVCPVPVVVRRDYGLPAWAAGPNTLVIASSHSGNTEETLSAFAAAGERGCRRLAISTGGKLAAAAAEAGAAHWSFEHAGQPRAGVGHSFGLLLAALYRLGLVPEPAAEVAEACAAMWAQAETLVKSVETVRNPGKRYAGQLMDRSITIFGAEFLAPVARRWKTQANELAKAWCQFEEIPEADHNALVGMEVPDNLTRAGFCMFLVSPLYGERNALRMELTRRAVMLEGVSTDFYLARGESRMAQLWTALQFGDFMMYYLALAYGIDPTPVEGLVVFKEEMEQH